MGRRGRSKVLWEREGGFRVRGSGKEVRGRRSGTAGTASALGERSYRTAEQPFNARGANETQTTQAGEERGAAASRRRWREQLFGGGTPPLPCENRNRLLTKGAKKKRKRGFKVEG